MSELQDSQISHDSEVSPRQGGHAAVDECPSQDDRSDSWLGPFRFRVDYEGFKGIYHAESDGSMRRLAMVLVVSDFVFAVTSFLTLIDNEGTGEGGALSFKDVFSCLLFIAVWLVALWSVVRPPLPGKGARAVGFFRYHGRRVAKREIVEYESAVLSVSLGRLGAEEVTDDGGLVRTPYAFMRRPVVSHGFLFAGLKNFRHDSVVWSMLGNNWFFRPDWDGAGVFVPVSCLGGRRGAWRVRRRVAGLVRSARWRFRRGVWWARLGRVWSFARRRAEVLTGPEVAWVEELGPDGRRDPEPEQNTNIRATRVTRARSSSVALHGSKTLNAASARPQENSDDNRAIKDVH